MFSCVHPCTFAAAFGRWRLHHAVKRFFASMTTSSTASAISAKSKRLCRFLNSALCSYPRFIFSPLPFKPTGALEGAPRLCRSVCASAPVTAVCPFRFAQKRARTCSERRSRFRSHGKQGGMTDAALCGWRDTLPAYLISGAPWRIEKGRGRALMGKRSDTYAALAACFAPSGARGHALLFRSSIDDSGRFLLVSFCASRVRAGRAAERASAASAKFITGTLTKRMGRKARRLDGCGQVTGVPIPHDMPIFIFLGKDRKAVTALYNYRNDCDNDAHVAAVEARIEEFEQYARTHSGNMKEPDTASR